VSKNSNFNISIHGLRGIASVSVLFNHIYGMGGKNQALWTSFETVGWFGSFWVCIFFCISGFLIAQTLEKHNSLRFFAKNRIIRIYPVFLVLHLIMFAIGPAKGYDWMGTLQYGSLDYFKAFFANLFFLPGIFDLPIAQKNAWSLSYEALFYVLAGLVWKTSKMHRGIIKNIFQVVLAAIGLSIIYTKTFAPFFAIGVGCYLIQQHHRRALSEFSQSSSSADASAGTALALARKLPSTERRLATLVKTPQPSWQQLPSTYRLGLPSLVIAAIGYTYHPLLAIPFMSIFFFEVAQQEAFSAQILRIRAMQFLGTISYSLYLIHPFVMDPVRSIAVKIAQVSPLTGSLVFIVFAPILSILVAWMSYQLIERKLTNFILSKI
jgi:peptidoglycan/LPS O-acetylase OafA/YrhL